MNQILYKRILPVIAGALLGFAYYYYVGCVSGSCAISSNPYISTLYGGFLGFLLSFPSKRKKRINTETTNPDDSEQASSNKK